MPCAQRREEEREDAIGVEREKAKVRDCVSAIVCAPQKRGKEKTQEREKGVFVDAAR